MTNREAADLYGATSTKTIERWKAEGAPLHDEERMWSEFLPARHVLPEGTQAILDARRGRTAAAAPGFSNLDALTTYNQARTARTIEAAKRERYKRESEEKLYIPRDVHESNLIVLRDIFCAEIEAMAAQAAVWCSTMSPGEAKRAARDYGDARRQALYDEAMAEIARQRQ